MNESERLKQKLLRRSGSAIAEFNMIEEGDRVMVCVSGGKDSYTMLELLM
ncbi:MAG TPA: tRNA 2-thiocytidine(32) synthetase TtcA, partial [Blastocatellia bacterium]|nr:tRNA 2-thiocytidine(32) synthetase TtcA [Blastocatellia bacterium]